MTSLMSAICDLIAAGIQEKLSNVLDESDQDVSGLKNALMVVEKLHDTLKTLTGTYWAGQVEHQYSQDPFQSQLIQSFKTRIKQIVEIKENYVLFCGLLSAEEQKELGFERVLSPFKNTNPLICTSYSQSS